MNSHQFFDAVLRERARQIELWGTEKDQLKRHGRAYTYYKTIVLGEEYGEVCRAQFSEAHPDNLKEELIQLAAVCQAWAETL